MIKKLRYLFTLMLLFVASVGWATEVESDLTFTAACGGTGTADDGAKWTVSSDADESNFDNTKGIHYGTGKKAVSYLTLTTSDIEGTISKIVVNASGASGTSANLDVKVGDVAFGTQHSLSSNATNYTFEGTASGTIEVKLSQTSATKALYVKSIVVTYDNGSTVELLDPELAFASTSATVTMGDEFTLPALTNNGDGAVTYSSSNTNVATVGETTGEVTIKAVGTTVITATSAKTETYKKGEATFTLTVEAAPFIIQDGVFDFVNAAAAGEDYGSGIETTTDGNHYETEASTWVAGNVTLVASGKYRWWSNGGTLRFYSNTPNSAMTISVPDGYVITKITITGGKNFEANGGYASGIWTGQSQEVVLSYTATSSSSNVETITVLYEEGTAKADAGLAYSAESYTATIGGTNEFPTLANPNGLTVSYASSDPEVATIDATGAITLVAAGTTTITATSDETEQYNAGEAKYTLTVVDPNAPGTEKNPYKVAEVLDLYASENVPSGEVYVKGIVSEINSLNTAEYSSARYYISDDGTTTNQFYVYNGKFIDGVNFTADYQLQVGDEVVVCGSLTSYQGTDEFAKNNKITSFNRPVKISAAKYATYITPYDATFESAVTAYTVTEIGADNITLTKIEGGVPAGTAVVVYAADANNNTYVATKAESVASVEGNLLKAVTSTEGLDSSDGNYYVLANKTQGVGFYPVISGTIAKGKGYLEVTDATAKDFYGFGGDETGIDDINVNDNVNANDAIYSISGQRLQKLQRGINIVNGKKIVVK